ncbi:MAG: hypothetical protein ACLU4J_02055 [Butyricimonas paravirosa]
MAIFTGCITHSPDKYDVQKMGMADMSQVKEIKLRMSHYQVLADGKPNLSSIRYLSQKTDLR